ncbi:hypothetical protein COCOBI_pt-0020 (chloroplast) [Coccomyxa sp. Obi]|nr:hypothetical protein COCOBI_pt-0020 [Coccomyxa sp. Obi]
MHPFRGAWDARPGVGHEPQGPKAIARVRERHLIPER